MVNYSFNESNQRTDIPISENEIFKLKDRKLKEQVIYEAHLQ